MTADPSPRPDRLSEPEARAARAVQRHAEIARRVHDEIAANDIGTMSLGGLVYDRARLLGVLDALLLAVEEARP